MRTVNASIITDAVAALCVRANRRLPADLTARIQDACRRESWPPAKETLRLLLDNAELAAERELPVCQDTGAACVFIEIGQDVRVTGGGLCGAVHAGVARGYAEGYLRASMVSDPLERINTGDNTPAFIHVDVVPGEAVKITLAPKGFGSENASRLQMLSPSDGRAGVVAFVLDAVERAGPNPCPPVIVGVGIGGTFDSVALQAKRALLRPVGDPHPDPAYAALESELLRKINALGIGPQGFGGATTALAVHVEPAPTHIAGLPVAVNLCCHVCRRAEVTL